MAWLYLFLAGLAEVAAQQGRRDIAALLWGFVRAGEESSGDRLHETELARYGRVLGELERTPATASVFALGRELTLAEAVEKTARATQRYVHRP